MSTTYNNMKAAIIILPSINYVYNHNTTIIKHKNSRPFLAPLSLGERMCEITRSCERFPHTSATKLPHVSACSRRVSTSFYYEQCMDSLRSCGLSSLRLLGYKQREFGWPHSLENVASVISHISGRGVERHGFV